MHRFSRDDIENAKLLLANESQANHKFRPSTESTEFLLIHQSFEQKRLLNLYGNKLCLLDSTYNTNKYMYPVFMVVVFTNTSYQVAGTFIIALEQKEAIKEALVQLKEWNPSWSPISWMTDYCLAEINAIEEIFPGV